MLKIEIKNRFTGSVIFEYTKENNSIKDTVQEYINQSKKRGCFADLRSADLSSADLSSADLRSADLSFANLRSANLRSADLRSADLSSANLRSANLSSANLRFANLRSADLSSANLDKRYISISCIGSSKRMTTYCFEDDIVWCGCFTGSLKEFEKKVKLTHSDNEQYLKEYLGFVKYLKSLK